jgi:hypothetical protein
MLVRSLTLRVTVPFENSCLPKDQLTSSQSNPKTARASSPTWAQAFASVCILIHLGTVILIASVNHQRSKLQDSVLTFIQPYTIGLNLYHEGLNAEMVSDASLVDQYRITVELQDASNGTPTERNERSWIPIVEYLRTDRGFHVDQAKQRQLLALLITLTRNDDLDGVLRILKGVVTHHESISKQKVKRVRLELPSVDENDLNASSALIVEDGVTCILASVARFDDGDVGLVGAVSALRSVPSKIERSTP